VNREKQAYAEADLKRFAVAKGALELVYNFTVGKNCLMVFNDVYCRWRFPKCDKTTGNITSQPICKESCEYVSKLCANELELAKTVTVPESDLMNCSYFEGRNGGDNPECYYTRFSNSKSKITQQN
jgi:hypothetical protein